MSTRHVVYTTLLQMQAKQGNGVVFIIKYTPQSGESRIVAGRVFDYVGHDSFALFDGRNEPDIPIDEVTGMQEILFCDYLSDLATELRTGGGVLTVKKIDGSEISTSIQPAIGNSGIILEDGGHQEHPVLFNEICGVPWISRLS